MKNKDKVMNLKKINIIIGREYSVRVKKKSFILTTLLTPVLFGLLIAIPSLIMLYGDDDIQKVAVIDNSGVVSPYFESGNKIEYQNETCKSIDQLKTEFDSLGLYAIVDISALDANSDVAVTSYSKEPLNVDVKSAVSKIIKKAIEDNKLKSYDIKDLDTIMAQIETNVNLNSITFSEDGSEKKDVVELYMILAYIMSFLIYGFVFMFGSMVMRGVIEEKTTRIIEVIVSSVKSFELMIGKIIGVALVALTQFFIWIALTLVIVSVFGTTLGKDLLKGSNKTEQIIQMTGTNASQIDGTSNSVVSLQNAAGFEEEGETSVIQEIMAQLPGINFVYIIGCFLIYFLLGYLLYAAMFAAVGSAVDNEADTNQLTLPITLPLMIGLFIMLHTFQHPNSSLSFWASMIPFTSPMVMMARIPFGAVPTWELLLSIGLLIGTFLLMVYISAKIYRVGILMFGKKATFKDLFKWMKSKD